MSMPEHSRGSGKTNGFAITSLVTAILGCTAWLGLIFGIVALVQIKNRGDRGRGMAIAGIVVACLWFAGSAIAWIAIPTVPTTPTGALPSATPAHTEPHDLDVSDIRPGQCFNDGANGNGDGDQEVEELTIVGCTSPHDAQALATFTFQRGPWPGDRALSKAASAQCRKRAGRKIAHDPARRILRLSWYLPTQQG